MKNILVSAFGGQTVIIDETIGLINFNESNDYYFGNFAFENVVGSIKIHSKLIHENML